MIYVAGFVLVVVAATLWLRSARAAQSPTREWNRRWAGISLVVGVVVLLMGLSITLGIRLH